MSGWKAAHRRCNMDEKTYLNAALNYASKGCKVFPLNGKIPAIKAGKGHRDATDDPDQIRSWWSGEYLGYNIGIATGSASGFWVLDVDGGEGKSGHESLAELEAKNGSLPATVWQTTGNGKHFLFRVADGKNIRISSGKVGQNLDVRGDGGYIVAAPSIHPGTKKAYQWQEDSFSISAIAEAPDWLVRLAMGDDEPVISPNPRTHANVINSNATNVLFQECDKIRLAIDGTQNSTLNTSSFYIGTLIAKGEIARDEAASALVAAGTRMASFDDHSLWTEEQINEIVQKGIADGQAKQEVLHDNYSRTIHGLNQNHALILLGGKLMVLREETNPISNLPDAVFISPSDFRTLHSNQKITIGQKSVKAGHAWIESSERRTYDGAVFAPQGAPPQYYNFWRGFAVEPRSGEIGKYLDHIKKVICSGDEIVYEYVLNFLADAVQNPSKRPGVALVLRGDQGVGKGVFVSNFGKLFGSHFRHVSSSHHLVGNFNSSLKDALVVFADEAFWAGDKAAEGSLKALITEDTNVIEMKGKDAFAVKNYVRLIVASNNDWIVPAGPNERRFCVLDVDESRRQDSTYFKAIMKEMKNGGRAALLDFLLKRNISGVNLSDFPKTQALVDQKMQSMDVIDKCLMDVLMRGYFTEEFSGWQSEIQKSDVQEALIESQKLTNQRSHSNQTQLGQRLKKVFPNLKTTRQSTSHGSRSYFYDFPSLEECRMDFASHIGFDPNWPEEGIV